MSGLGEDKREGRGAALGTVYGGRCCTRFPKKKKRKKKSNCDNISHIVVRIRNYQQLAKIRSRTETDRHEDRSNNYFFFFYLGIKVTSASENS